MRMVVMMMLMTVVIFMIILSNNLYLFSIMLSLQVKCNDGDDIVDDSDDGDDN